MLKAPLTDGKMNEVEVLFTFILNCELTKWANPIEILTR